MVAHTFDTEVNKFMETTFGRKGLGSQESRSIKIKASQCPLGGHYLPVPKQISR